MIEPTIFTGMAGQLGYFIHVHKHFRVNAISEHYFDDACSKIDVEVPLLSHEINHLVTFMFWSAPLFKVLSISIWFFCIRLFPIKWSSPRSDCILYPRDKVDPVQHQDTYCPFVQILYVQMIHQLEKVPLFQVIFDWTRTFPARSLTPCLLYLYLPVPLALIVIKNLYRKWRPSSPELKVNYGTSTTDDFGFRSRFWFILLPFGKYLIVQGCPRLLI